MKFSPSLTVAEVQAAFAGRFTHLEILKEGGQGSVFKARPSNRPNSGTTVALKIYFPDSLTERTRREVDTMRRLQCETLVRLHDAGRVDLRGRNCIYVATDFIEGDVLSTVLTRGPTKPEIVARAGHDIALAIDTLWQERIVHRDIKPDNVMLCSNGRVLLIDLGVARHIAMSPLTTAGKTWGTEGYMSPEQARALRQLSCKSDVFSLGIVLQECLLGRHPTGYDQLALINGWQRTKILLPKLADPLPSIIDEMLARDAHRRPIPSQVVKSLKQCF